MRPCRAASSICWEWYRKGVDSWWCVWKNVLIRTCLLSSRLKVDISTPRLPVWTCVGDWQNVLIRTSLLSFRLNVGECTPRVPVLFETLAHVNHLVPLRPIPFASPKELADQYAMGGMRHPTRAIARLSHACTATIAPCALVPFRHGRSFQAALTLMCCPG